MKNIGLAAAWIVSGALALAGFAHGHGGTYRGPGDTVPAGGGGNGGGVPTPGGPGPGAPTPGNPLTPGGITPGQPGGGPGGVGPAQTGGGVDAGTDLSVWQFWWGFNKDPYLNLRAKVHAGNVTTGSDEFWIGQGQQSGAKETLAPSELEIRGQIVPALRRVLREERNNNILSGAMVALARIGDDPKSESGRSELAAEFTRFLGDPTQEVAETAALCLGILGSDSPDTLALLAGIAENDVGAANAALERIDERTPRLSGAFNYRTRSFAAYALGLVGAKSALPERRREIVQRLVRLCDGPARELGNYDLAVACIVAIGLVPLEDVAAVGFAPAPGKPFPRPAGLTKRAEQVAWLMAYYEDERNTYLVRAHVPRAVARLCASTVEREDTRALKASVARRLLADSTKLARTENELKQSCLLALGALGDCDDDELDREIRAGLMAARKELSDQTCRSFAAIALAQVGGRPGTGDRPLAGLEGTRESENVRSFLIDGLERGKGGYRAWAGLALGVLERSLSDAHQPTSADVRLRLRTALAEAASPAEIGAFAIATGIQLDVDSTGVLRAKFASTADEEARGYVAVALGLVNDRDSIATITGVVEKSRFRPELMRSAAIGLGLMGDKAIVPALVDMLDDARGLASQAAISQALGFIGDRRAIEPLVKFLGNREHTDTSRGFAAAALGMVADRSMLPWNSTISIDLNYRASVPTLTAPGVGTGLLDIL